MASLQEQFNCKSCGECCKRYSITVLPEEAKAEAELLGIGVQEFVEKYCRLYLELFPMNPKENSLVLSQELLPKRIVEGIEALLGKPAEEHYLVLPMLAFRKEEYCVFFEFESRKCKIHSAKPAQCRFFPFISIKPNPDFKIMYPFCAGLREMAEAKGNGAYGMEHYAAVRGYFEGIKENGFPNYWAALPESGIALLEGKEICEISGEEFAQAIGAFE